MKSISGKVYRRRRPTKGFRVKLPPCRVMNERERLIYEWSHSKLSMLLNCPLQFWFKYVLRIPEGLQPVIRIVGQALHYHGRDFFVRKFMSPQSFADAWMGFWLGIANGKHGPEYGDPVPIAWVNKEREQQHWIARGILYSKDFYGRNVELRDRRVVRLQEQDFRVDWDKFRLIGKYDRVDEHQNHTVIIDYKMRRFPAHELDMLDQAIFYTIAYRNVFQPLVFNGKPLGAFKLETLGTLGEDAYQDVIIPGPQEEEVLYEVLTAASMYVWALVEGKPLPEELRPRLSSFPQDGDGQAMLWPRLPRGKHCENCDFVPSCIAWVKENLPTRRPDARFQLLQHRAALRRERMPNQLELELTGL